MKASKQIMRLSILSLAMASISVSMYAYADDQEAAALMNPTSSVEVEQLYVSQSSQKFGEYNGLNKQGGYLNGNINVRGGDAYKDNEKGGTNRWSINGTDLGLSDRSASVGFSDQGNWGVNVGYDELQHNLAPGYQTPYIGSMGGNNFTLGGFGTVNTGGNGTRVLTGPQQAAFTPMDISSTRQNTSLSATKQLDSGLSASFDFNHLNQSGAKLQSFGNSSVYPGVQGEKAAVMPNPTNYQTDTVNLALNWLGEKGHLTGSYFGSFFRDGYNGVNFATWASAGTTSTTQIMSTAPSNQLQQLNLGGGYSFSNSTKLAGNFSFGRNTQNTASMYDGYQTQAGYPAPAFNGLVNTSHADLKLTDQSIKDLHLSAGFKYDARDNLSQSSTQRDYGIGYTTGSTQLGIYPNVPLSYRKALVELAGEYRISKGQQVQVVLANQNLNRYCNQYGVGPTANYGATGYYPAGADCVLANYNRTNSLNAVYKVKATEDVDIKLGYGASVRQATTNPNSLTTFSQSSSYYGFNGGSRVGYMPFFEASQNQQNIKANANWRAREDLSFGLGGKWTYSTYPASVYGVQNSTVASINLDSVFDYAEEASATAYITQQFGQRSMTNYSSATLTWNNTLQENDTTLGLGIKHGGLLAGKLVLKSDLTYSLGQSMYQTMPVPGGICGTTGACGSPGPIKNIMASLKFGGDYTIDKSSKIGLKYIYQHLRSNDYYYNVYGYGQTASGVLPTMQTSGSYNVNVIAATYTYSFD